MAVFTTHHHRCTKKIPSTFEAIWLAPARVSLNRLFIWPAHFSEASAAYDEHTHVRNISKNTGETIYISCRVAALGTDTRCGLLLHVQRL